MFLLRFKSAVMFFLPALIVFAGGNTVFARGLNDMETANDTVHDDAAEAESTESAPTEPQKPLQAVNVDAPANAVAAPIAPSAMSVAIANRLIVGTSLGYVSLDGPEGSWGSSWAPDLSVHWRTNLLGDGAHGLLALLRYQPVDVTAEIDRKSYRGVVAGYYLGGAYRFNHGPVRAYFASIECGYQKVGLDSTDDLQVGDENEDGGVTALVGLGMDWRFMPKLTFGPRLAMGFGTFSLFEFDLATNLYF